MRLWFCVMLGAVLVGEACSAPPSNGSTDAGQSGDAGRWPLPFDAGAWDRDAGACSDTWASFGQPFFAATCVSCHVHDHTSFANEADVKAQLADISMLVSTGKMPQGLALSDDSSARLLAFLECLKPVPPMDGGVDAGVPFETTSAATAVSKMKMLLVGLPATQAEITAVSDDAKALKGLITQWMKRPEYEEKMLVFFELAFQQTQIDGVDFKDIAPPDGLSNGAGVRLLIQNVRESFARTALALIDEGRPFTETFTTRRVMLTPALKETYAFLDTRQATNERKITDAFKTEFPSTKLTLSKTSGPIPLEQSVDPTHPNFMHFYDPDIGNLDPNPDCNEDPLVLLNSDAYDVHAVLYAAVRGHKGKNATNCRSRNGTVKGVQLTDADFSTWQMVTIRPPAPGEATTRFFNIPALRTATMLVLRNPRVGFFTTPAFQANWPTNQANQMRVTTNQTLIVATGMDLNVADQTVVTSTPGLDEAHASRPECYSCHRLLDPTRSIFSSSYSWYYSVQADPLWSAERGQFAFEGLVAPVDSLAAFGATLASHPAVAEAWAQKLCAYANSAKCEPSDPEFQRIVQAFKQSNFSWPVLIQELFSSPILTNLAPSETAARHGEVVGVDRRDHFCAALDSRLGLNDACGLKLKLGKPGGIGNIPKIITGMPSDGYGRGATEPILPNDPTLFYRVGVENICAAVADLVIDAAPNKDHPTAKHWVSTSTDAAIGEFVSDLMGLTASDERTLPITALLKAHYTAALVTESPTDSLKSTFVAACVSPSLLGVGL